MSFLFYEHVQLDIYLNKQTKKNYIFLNMMIIPKSFLFFNNLNQILKKKNFEVFRHNKISRHLYITFKKTKRYF